MDRIPTWVDNDEVLVDIGSVIRGLPIGTELGVAVEPICIEPAELE